uniref:Uncharacterized protein n=1 Tax=Ditylenchus dipsaci TaxID=166011 RepID=A0A915ETL2_9BILA
MRRIRKLADVKDLKIQDFFGEDLSFAHEQNHGAANPGHAEAGGDTEGDQKEARMETTIWSSHSNLRIWRSG